MEFEKITESDSIYRHLENMSVSDLLTNMNYEDKSVPYAVEKALPQIERVVISITDKMVGGGRLFYIGAGTSGRLGILDASECVPTFGVSKDLVIGMIAGGETAIRNPVEFAEDDEEQGWEDLKNFNVSEKDFVIGITASGTTPYVIGALKKCRASKIPTGSISCNPGAPISKEVDYPIEVVVGPEFLTGSSRLKAGTAQKLVLNMISTSVMIQLGRVEDNKMVNMELTNNKLVDRGVKMIMKSTSLSYKEAKTLLMKHKSVKKTLELLK
ncbi:MAG: N-acetylmuramic acid 6-phosphate etherase [Ginsengibacter sp.]